MNERHTKTGRQNLINLLHHYYASKVFFVGNIESSYLVRFVRCLEKTRQQPNSVMISLWKALVALASFTCSKIASS